MRAGQGFLAIWSDVPPELETDYLHWMTREHAQERLGVPGFRSVRFFRCIEGAQRRFFILYTLDDARVVASAAYLSRLNAPTPWSQRIMPMLMNFRRGGGTVEMHCGSGRGGVVAPVLVGATEAAGQSARLNGLVEQDRIVAGTLLRVAAAETDIRTNEKALRADDQSFDALVLVEALDAAALAPLAGTQHDVFTQIFALGAVD